MVTNHASAITHLSLDGHSSVHRCMCIPIGDLNHRLQGLSTRELIWLTDEYLMLGESGISELKSIDRCLGEM